MDHKFKKKFGQNFIKDNTLIKKIVSYASIDKDSLVIEIGPGAGALTEELCLSSKYVLAYEIDLDLKDKLEELKKDNNNLEIIFDDFLKRDVIKDIKKYDYKHLYVISNLPYYITTPIINKLITDKIDVEKLVIMVQKEVASRFLAKSNSRDYSSLTVFLNYHFDIKKLFDVSRNVFVPKPNVDSSVVELKRKKDKINVKDIDFFYKLVRDSFRFKRKNIKNNLNGYNLDKIKEILEKYNLDLTVRAEDLDLDIFIEICNNLCN